MTIEFDRRVLLTGASALTGASLALEHTMAAPVAGSEAIGLGAAEAVAAMRRGDLQAEDYATALLAQARRFQSLNAFRTLKPEMVMEAARAADRKRGTGAPLGRLHGLPIPIKDSVDTASLPTSNGTRALEDFRPGVDAEVVKRLLADGAIVMGKTNLHELSFGWTSDNATFGAVRNAYDPARSPGGSSGGSATAVAARMAPLAVAEDTWASIRLPAAFCGLVGLRPTYGRCPDAGIMPLTTMFDQVGPLARSVADIILFDSVAAADDRPIAATPLASAKIGLPNGFFWDGLAPSADRVAREALARLRAAGLGVVDIETGNEVHDAPSIAATVISYQARDSIAAFLKRSGAPVSFDEMFAKVGPNVHTLMSAMALPPNRPSREVFEAALVKRAALGAAITQIFATTGIAALVFPVAMCAPPRIGENEEVSIAGQTVPLATALARNTALGSCLGMASLVLPAGLDAEGLPVGLEFVAPPGADRALLGLGLAMEAALGPLPPPKALDGR